METPVFVKIDDYKKLLSEMDAIKTKISSIKKIITQIESLREQEAKELALWIDNIDSVEKEITIIDQTLFEPEN